MRVIQYEGRPAGLVTVDQTCLLPHIRVLEPDHPMRRRVICLAMFAQDLAAGRLTGAFTDGSAAHFARCALIPDDDFLRLAAHDDVLLAELFDVPLAQIAEKRRDLRALGSPAGPPRRS
jgi:hypothetical protein